MLAAARGAEVSGIDAAEGMLAIARRRLPDADLRLGAMEELPWKDGRFDVVTAVNALQFAPDFVAALREAARVARPGGRLAIANWGPREDCEVNMVDDTFSPPPPGRRPTARPGGLTELARQAGIARARGARGRGPVRVARRRDGRARVPLRRPRRARSAAILAAAAPFRRPDGSYRFENRFNLLVAEVYWASLLPARDDEPGLVGEHDGLDAVAQPELAQHVGDVGLDRRVAEDERRGDLGVGHAAREQQQHLVLARRELVELRGPGAAGGPMRANSSIRRRVTVGASSASPAATARMPSASCSGGVSLSRKPLAPAWSAS